mmetsp:Transcript_113063/g.200458  ORF Transcript_113063/g.200458 Transcript_113063/m.200458 type:complete len:240 (+) Transcript_113063:321-1040(+)
MTFTPTRFSPSMSDRLRNHSAFRGSASAPLPQSTGRPLVGSVLAEIPRNTGRPEAAAARTALNACSSFIISSQSMSTPESACACAASKYLSSSTLASGHFASALEAIPGGISGGCVDSEPTTIAGPKPEESQPCVATGSGGITGVVASSSLPPSLAARDAEAAALAAAAHAWTSCIACNASAVASAAIFTAFTEDKAATLALSLLISDVVARAAEVEAAAAVWAAAAALAEALWASCAA